MAGIPLFSTEYLTSPTMFGAISPKTAQLFMEEGERLSKQIEEMSTKAEAGAKAPAIATAYADGLSRIRQGDMSGLERVAQARAQSVGNPFLESMAKDAERTASQFASQYLQEQSLKTRLEFQADRDDSRFDQTMALERERDANLTYRQASDDHRNVVARNAEADARSMQGWQQAMAAEERQAQLEPGYVPRQIAKPQPTKNPPPPTRAVPYGSPAYEGLPQEKTNAGGGLMGDDPIPEKLEGGAATGPMESSVESQQAAAPAPVQQPLVNEKGSAVEIVEPNKIRQPQKYEKSIVAPFGRMNWVIQTPQASKVSVTETVETATGNKVYKIGGDKEDDIGVQFAQKVAKADSMDHQFAVWASNQFLKGKKVNVGPDVNNPDGPWIAKNSDGEHYGQENPAAKTDKSAPPTITLPVAKQVGEAWNEASSLMPQLQGKIQPQFPPTRDEVKAARTNLIAAIQSGEVSEEEGNRELKKIGEPALKKDEIGAKDSKPFAPTKPKDAPQEDAKIIGVEASSPAELKQELLQKNGQYQKAIAKGDIGKAETLMQQIIQMQAALKQKSGSTSTVR